MNNFSAKDFKFHPLRETLYNELHTRPFHDVSTPQQITHLAVSARHQDQEQMIELLRQLCQRHNIPLPDSAAAGFRENFGAFTLQFERHDGFYALSIMRSFQPGEDPFLQPPIELLPKTWLDELPGKVVAAFNLVVVDGNYPAGKEDLSRYFEGHSISISGARQGRVNLYNSFRVHTDDFGRIMIRNLGLPDAQIGRMVRRLIEVETYRLLSVMPLSLAKQIAPQLAEMDRELAQLLQELSKLELGADEHELLQRLSQLEARLETWRSETNRRFSAANAYHELVQDRLGRIEEEKVEGYTTLGEFMLRRLKPAQRTCNSVYSWMGDLSQRVERASDLLRTRANLTLQGQNRSLLATMNRRSRLQFRLQETVEGLSVVAISYYLVGLIGYLLTGLPLSEWGISKATLVAVAVPLVLVYVIWITKRIKHRLIKTPLEEE